MQAVWVKMKKGRLYWLLSVYPCFVHWVDSHCQSTAGRPGLHRSCPWSRKCLIATRESVWKLSRCMWRRLLVLRCLRRVYVCKGGEITVKKMRKALWQWARSVQGCTAALCLFVLHCKTERCQVYDLETAFPVQHWVNWHLWAFCPMKTILKAIKHMASCVFSGQAFQWAVCL